MRLARRGVRGAGVRSVLALAVELALAQGCDGGAVPPPAPDGGACGATAMPELSCAAPITVACTGARTPATLAPASWRLPCGAAVPPAPTSDAPSGGFAVGETTVTFSGEGGASCTVAVTVTDDDAPAIDCPASPIRVVRLAEDDPIAAVAVRPATDACDDAPALALEGAAPTGRGTFPLVSTATDRAGNVARCAFTAEVLDLFAPREARILSAELAGDGSTDTTLAWLPPLSPDVALVVLERAPTPAGPFTALARMPVTTLTYTDAAMPSPRAAYRLVSVGPDALRGGETEILEAHAIARAGYDLPAQAVPGVPFRTTLHGVVRHPADLGAGPYPLVVFLHGNHGNCRPATGDDECMTLTENDCARTGFTTTPNAAGYAYLQDSLAAQGFVSVSIGANALNCRDDFIPERTALVVEHLRRWAAGTLPLEPALLAATDETRTSLVGHSRGGEAVSRVPAALRTAPVAGVRLASVLAVGPTDYHDNAPSGVPYLALLPGCDADVFDLQGARMVDRGAAAADGEIKAHVLFVGTNHNFFNTEWRFDDDADRRVCAAAARVPAAAQRAGLEALLGAWLGVAVRGGGVPAWLRNEEGSPDWMDAWASADLDLRETFFSAERVVVDDFEGSLSTNALGLGVTMTGYTASTTCTGTCAPNFVHAAPGARLAWDAAAATASFTTGGLDASRSAAISFRVASRRATINDGTVAHDLTVRVRDTRGGSVELPLTALGAGTGLRHLYPARLPLEVLETFRVPLATIAADLDVSSIAAIELAMPVPGHARGSIWVSSLELAGD